MYMFHKLDAVMTVARWVSAFEFVALRSFQPTGLEIGIYYVMDSMHLDARLAAADLILGGFLAVYTAPSFVLAHSLTTSSLWFSVADRAGPGYLRLKREGH